MLVPIADVHRSRRGLWITLGMLGLSAGVFVAQLGVGLTHSVWQGGVIPWEISHARSLEVPSRLHPGLTIIVSILLHGGLLHLLGTMLCLWVFGPGVEVRMGHRRFLLLYLISGIVGTAVHVVVHPASLVPVVGASGAITGVLGAYLFLHPKGRIRSVLILLISLPMVKVPAVAFVALWIAFHIATALVKGPETVTVFTHLGGFITGYALADRWSKRP